MKTLDVINEETKEVYGQVHFPIRDDGTVFKHDAVEDKALALAGVDRKTHEIDFQSQEDGPQVAVVLPLA